MQLGGIRKAHWEKRDLIGVGSNNHVVEFVVLGVKWLGAWHVHWVAESNDTSRRRPQCKPVLPVLIARAEKDALVDPHVDGAHVVFVERERCATAAEHPVKISVAARGSHHFAVDKDAVRKGRMHAGIAASPTDRHADNPICKDANLYCFVRGFHERPVLVKGANGGNAFIHIDTYHNDRCM
jgi:hypothetical protein